MPVLSGEDKFGDFRIREGYCDHCRKTVARVDWLSFKLPSNVDPRSRTLISNINHKGEYVFNALPKLGVTCGCYSRFHRQIAHIGSGKVSPDRG